MTIWALDPRLASGTESGYRGAEHRIHGCQSCGGTWVTRSTLNAIIREAEARSVPITEIEAPQREMNLQSKVVYRNCPSCAQIMNRRNFAWISGIIVDECLDCGTYFDAGELEGIVAFVRAGGLTLAKRRQIARETKPSRPRAEALPTHNASGAGKLKLLTDYDEIDLLLGFLRWAGRWLRDVATRARERM